MTEMMLKTKKTGMHLMGLILNNSKRMKAISTKMLTQKKQKKRWAKMNPQIELTAKMMKIIHKEPPKSEKTELLPSVSTHSLKFLTKLNCLSVSELI